MQRDIDQIMTTVVSRATAEVARQELQELVAQWRREHERRVTQLERERDAARNERDERVATLERERDRRITVLERERDAARNERDECVAELELARALCNDRDLRVAALERELDILQHRAAALERERDAALEKQAAARRERFTLRQQVTTLEEEQGILRSKFTITRQDDLLRHVLSATVDFGHFTVRDVVAAGGNGIVLLCYVTVPAWCVVDEAAAAPAAAAAGAATERGADDDGRPTTQVAVAVKVLAGVEDPRQTTLKHAFLREFQTLSDMPPHPNVITLLAFLTKSLPKPMYDLLPDGFRLMMGDAANPVLALIMPLLPRTLQAAAAAGASPAQLVRWCLDVSAAVAHMWAYRWVHLDLKLNNVLVANDGRAVLTDMGTAMPVAADGALTLPAHVGLSGNPAHRAPEVLAAWERARHAPTSMVRMDAGRQEVWALGVLLHELVAGKHPYGDKYPLGGHDGAPVVDEATLVARGLAVDTVAVVRRMVSSDPGARPVDPAAAYAELVASVPAVHSPAAPQAAVTLRDVEQAYHASQLNLPLDPATRKPVPNEWGRQLQAWSEEHDAARLCLAVLMRWGWGGVQKDPSQARTQAKRYMAWCRGAAEGGEAVAQWLLGMCCHWGMGVAKDLEQAAAWWRRAAEQGHAGAQRGLGVCYLTGEGVAKDCEQAAAWLRRAAEQGDANAQHELSARYFTGEGVAQDCAQAVEWIRRAAAQGHAEAQHELGLRYCTSAGVAKDHAQAVAWFRRAAEQGHAEAQTWLGTCYLNGDGVAQDRAQAVAWFRRAAEQGLAHAQHKLGVRYFIGEGVARDRVQAVTWFRRAAEKGYANAQHELGVRYFTGEGVAQDRTQAAAWFRRAAEQGFAHAQHELGLQYKKGEGVVQDYAQAVTWLRRAAEQGHAAAQCSYGECYQNGLGVAQNHAQAVVWFRRAAAQGHAEAQRWLRLLGE